MQYFPGVEIFEHFRQVVIRGYLKLIRKGISDSPQTLAEVVTGRLSRRA